MSYPQVHDWDNLYLAWRKAARGERFEVVGNHPLNMRRPRRASSVAAVSAPEGASHVQTGISNP
jgi:hypothetical protein